MAKKENYVKALQKDKKKTAEYYLKSLKKKTEQQKFLEKLLAKRKVESKKFLIADIACGVGSLSFHLSNINSFKKSDFYLVDFNPDAIKLAEANLSKPNFKYFIDSVYSLKTQPSNYFDFVFCWQTLSWLNDPQKALKEIIRITKPGGRIFLSSLFNLNADVDVFSNVIDYSHNSSKQGMSFSYNTYSAHSVEKWIKPLCKYYKFHEFIPNVDFKYNGKGLGTYTIKSSKGKRLQISAGMLLNWAVLEIKK
jgi:ubiquinone/menaquinone biosynthesis C-methylase UbiE